ncbi:MAG: helix-turn-helix domain-containing protein [Bernardetiaceae bacterium]
MSHPHKHPKDLPVYCIENFDYTQASSPSRHFNIQRLEELLAINDFAHTPHRHNFYDILVFTAGTGTHTIDFIEYPIKPCSIFFLTPGQVHALSVSPDVKGFTVFFDPEFYLLDRPARSLHQMPFFHRPQSKPFLKIDCRQEAYVQGILEEMLIETQGQHTNREAVIRANLELLMLKLSRFYHEGQTDDQQRHSPYFIRLLTQFDQLIDENFKTTRSVQFYADALCVTPKNLSSICKKIYNKTSREIIQERVILEAKRLLLHSDMSMIEIAQTLNLYDPSYFVKFFKKVVGQTPQQFRMQKS